MSARAPRRSFATPFVLTLAAIPAACVASSPPPPSSPSTGPQASHEHEPAHGNPPRPQAEPPWQQEANPQNAGNQQAPDATPATPTPTPPVAQAEPPSSPKPRGYREWTVSRTDGKCSSMVKVHCPDGAMCNPPPPAKYDCPKFMADNDRIDVIQRTEKAECYVDHGDFTCPPAATCNPPRPQKVACPK